MASFMSWTCSNGRAKMSATAKRLSGGYASHANVSFTDILSIGFGGGIPV